jgi:hypothetical protein
LSVVTRTTRTRWPTITPYDFARDERRLAKLLRRDDRVMSRAKVLSIAVDVLATVCERHLMVDHGGKDNEPFVVAHLAKTVSPVHASLPLLLPCATTEPVVLLGSLPGLALVCHYLVTRGVGLATSAGGAAHAPQSVTNNSSNMLC